MLTRRTLLKSATAGGALLAFSPATRLYAQAVSTLTPFVDPLPLPSNALPVGVFKTKLLYRLTLSEFFQKLHRDLPATQVWGYNGTYPGPTIEVDANKAIYVDYVNKLPNRAHPLPVQTCVHLPHHLPDPVTPHVVTHLHGGRVPQTSDGYPEWVLAPGERAWHPGPGDTKVFEPYLYPNIQNAATLWYHDHALGMTRLNVMMGLAGFYLIRDPHERFCGLPSGAFDIPLAIQDRTFTVEGTRSKFFYPNALEPEFFGDTMLVNGKVWPYFNVRRGKYRFRLLNGCNSRFLTLALSTGDTFWQVATEQGLLPEPVQLTSLTMGPGERAEIVIDFARYRKGEEIILTNSANSPFPNGDPVTEATARVMKFKVVTGSAFTLPLPTRLVAKVKGFVDRALSYDKAETLDPAAAKRTRRFTLGEFEPTDGTCTNEAGFVAVIEDEQGGRLWDDINTVVPFGDIEMWEFVNNTPDTHPMHLHLVQFQVHQREVNGQISGPLPSEAGWKDTVQVHPGETVRLLARFDGFKGTFPFHCHILEHEDHEMMRQYRVE